MNAEFLSLEELNNFPRRIVNSGDNICLPNNSADLVFVIEDGQAKIKNQIIHTGEIIGFIDIVEVMKSKVTKFIRFYVHL